MSDAGLFVRFNLVAKEDPVATAREGRPMFRDVEYIEIHVPGDKTNVPHRPVTDEDRQRFATTYNAWKRGQGEALVGQPLKEWAAISPAEVAMLAHSNVHTVEALAEVSDENAGRIGPILALRAKAKVHIESSRHAAPVEALKRQMVAQEQRLAQQQQQMAEQQQQMQELLTELRKARSATEERAPAETTAKEKPTKAGKVSKGTEKSTAIAGAPK